MLDKHFQVNITIRCKSADVVALAGSFAEHIEANCADVVDSIEVNTHVYASKSYTMATTLAPATTLSPAIEPAPVPEPPVQDEKPKRSRKTKFEPAVKAVEVSIPVVDLHPDTVAELNAVAAAQGELPLPEVEGAEIQVTLEEPAEVITTYSAPRELTRDDGFSALRGLIERKGNDAAKAALAKLGYVKFSDVPTERMGELLDAVDEVGA